MMESRRVHEMIRRACRIAATVLLLSSVSIGCAVRTAEPVPEVAATDPFAQWVAQIEPGRTDIEDIASRFGPPAELEERLRGGTVWRYAHPEISWPENDPRRPVVSAEGEVEPAGPTWWQQVGARWRSFRRWRHRTFYLPAAQPRPPRKERLPATIHRLEVLFGVDGTVEAYRYVPEEGSARVEQLL